VKCERQGEILEDFQTVDLEAEYMSEHLAWTTWGKIVSRAGGEQKTTIVRSRRYLADSVFLVATTFEPPNENPTIEEVAQRIQKPARPLFIGRKSCLPAAPMFLSLVEAADFEDALQSARPIHERRRSESLLCWRLSVTPEGSFPELIRPVCDRRDFENQVHVGQRFMVGFYLPENKT
jgi:CRISPR system Cascade subunit CasD